MKVHRQVEFCKGVNMVHGWTLIACSAFGAFVMEFLHWYQLKHKLLPAKYNSLLKSRFYWTVTALFIFSAGVSAWIWFSQQGSVPAKDAFLFGAGLPTILKKILKTPQDRTLGAGKGLQKGYFDV
jgi:hypothetical protein